MIIFFNANDYDGNDDDYDDDAASSPNLPHTLPTFLCLGISPAHLSSNLAHDKSTEICVISSDSVLRLCALHTPGYRLFRLATPTLCGIARKHLKSSFPALKLTVPAGQNQNKPSHAPEHRHTHAISLLLLLLLLTPNHVISPRANQSSL